MPKIICVNNPPNSMHIEMEKDLCIGDIVEVFDGGYQYSTYFNAYKQLWGNTDNYRVPYDCDGIPEEERKISNSTLTPLENRWKIINMIAHHLNNDVLLHLRSRDWKNCLIGIDGVRLIRKAKKRPEIIEIDRINNNT